MADNKLKYNKCYLTQRYSQSTLAVMFSNMKISSYTEYFFPCLVDK